MLLLIQSLQTISVLFSPIFSSCNGGGGSVKNGRLSVDSEGQPVSQQSMKKGKNDTNASASPIPREPFDLAQLKAYGKQSYISQVF